MEFEEVSGGTLGVIKSIVLNENLRNPVIKILGVDHCIGCGGCQDRSIHFSYMIDVVDKPKFEEFLENPQYYSLVGKVAGLPVYISRKARSCLTDIGAEKLRIENVDQTLVLFVNRP